MSHKMLAKVKLQLVKNCPMWALTTSKSSPNSDKSPKLVTLTTGSAVGRRGCCCCQWNSVLSVEQFNENVRC